MPNTFRIKRRAAGGAAGAPSTLAAAELAYNEQDDILYYGKGNSGGLATNVIPIAGPGFAAGASVATASGFTAHKSLDQSIATDTWTKLDFGSTAYNNGSFYNTSTSRYTPPAGEVCLNVSVWCDGILPGSDIYLAIYKNGAILKFGTGNTSNGAAEITCIDQASGTDYYEAWVFAYTGGPNYFVRTGNNDIVFFQAFLPVGPPGPQGVPGATAINGTPVTGQLARWANAFTIEGYDTSALFTSPTLTGTPTAPTAAPGTATTQLATTAFAAAVAAASSWSTGDVKLTYKQSADPGWILLDDGSIGDATSGASTRANADTSALFTLFWAFSRADVAAGTAGTCAISNANPAVVTCTAHGLVVDQRVRFTTTATLPAPLNTSTDYYVISAGLAANTFRISTTIGGAAISTLGGGGTAGQVHAAFPWISLPLQTSAGAFVERGASAAADFGAHKRLLIPKALGRSLAVAGAGTGLSARYLGETAGAETHTQTQLELVSHSHPVTPMIYAGQATLSMATPDITIQYSISSAIATSATGSNVPMSVLDPSTYMNVMVKL